MRRFLALAGAAALLLTACGTSAAERAAQSPSAGNSVAASEGGGHSVDIVSCGQTLHFDAPPSRVLVLGDTSVSNLDALGLMDRINLRAGSAHFDSAAPELQAKFDAIESVEAGKTDTGGVKLATETILNSHVDLVIGYDKGVEREQVAKAGVQLYSPEAYCPEYSVEKASWDLIDNEINNLARIFGVEDKAKSVIADIHAKTSKLKADAPSGRGTGAALYITAGSTRFSAYGSSSMSQSILDANGITNVYGDNTTRVFDGSMEDLLARNPDWIVLLSSGASDEETIQTFKSFSGAEQLKAVANDHVVVIPFVLTDPPNVLSVEGAATLAEKTANK
ncbi:ABC transporter substrate-binding protein [[Pseudopropionibacterium] massiliense]|uniref:ABC transporter substrate-binding protein n=1 Tax=[Pseudopropionibacterium] massiliense TaxID=2220000 RepID=UPI001FED1021|nr:ABC transporter substrate-binding protein [[Pseudopropionibacterium] massiliense]